MTMKEIMTLKDILWIKSKIEKWEMFYNENGVYPADCIMLETEEMDILNPFVSECGRFEVMPWDYYGVDEWNDYYDKMMDMEDQENA